MKKTFALLLALVMIVTTFAGCGSAEKTPDTTPATTGASTQATEAAPTKTETEPLVVAVQNQYCSGMVQEILDANLQEEFDCPIELLIFDGGPAINEAVGQWDIAITGGAFIYAVANYDCHLIAHQCDGTGPDAMYCRAGDPILEAGDDKAAAAEAVRGKTVLTNLGTTAHYMLILWLDSLGLTMEDVNVVSQTFDNMYASWLAGEGDYFACTSSYVYEVMKYDEYVKVANFDDIGGKLFESTICSDNAYKNKYDQVVKFVAMLYKATDNMAKDENLHFEAIKSWLWNNGRELDDSDIKDQCGTKWMMSIDYASQMDLTEFATFYGDFYISNDLIEASKRDVIAANIATDIHADALALLTK